MLMILQISTVNDNMENYPLSLQTAKKITIVVQISVCFSRYSLLIPGDKGRKRFVIT